MPETLWLLAKRSVKQPNCLSRRRVFGCSVASIEPQLQDILSDGYAPAQLPPFTLMDNDILRIGDRNDVGS